MHEVALLKEICRARRQEHLAAQERREGLKRESGGAQEEARGWLGWLVQDANVCLPSALKVPVLMHRFMEARQHLFLGPSSTTPRMSSSGDFSACPRHRIALQDCSFPFAPFCLFASTS
jgi:hypothetical protein